jgi:hypothetical protein
VTLSEATGGFAAVHTNDYTSQFQRVVDENGSYYLLGYSSTNTNQNGKFRNIRVEAKQLHLTVRARSGYATVKAGERPAGPTGGLSADLNALVNSPLPVSGLTLSVAAAPFRNQDKSSIGIVVEAHPSQFQSADQNGRFSGTIELAIVAADKDGKTVGENVALSMPLTGGARSGGPPGCACCRWI